MYTEMRRCLAIDCFDEFGPKSPTKPALEGKVEECQNYKETHFTPHPSAPGLHVRANLFLTTGRRGTSPSRGPPPPREEALRLKLDPKEVLRPRHAYLESLEKFSALKAICKNTNDSFYKAVILTCL